ncbi:MAG: hypothetical protein ABR598_00410 [Candidatus Dormibacteria bacterium]
MLNTTLTNNSELYRRHQLHNLDAILADLEVLNLRDAHSLPRSLTARLRRAGVACRDQAPVSELIDLVFRAQEPFLTPMALPPTRRRSAA